MTATMSPQSTEHLIQICRERSARGVATRADWERLAEIKPKRARLELIDFLEGQSFQDSDNPFETKKRRFAGAFIGFLVGVVFMAAWWLFADYLNREVVTSGKQWDLVTMSQYVAASLLPVFAWIGWRFDRNRDSEEEQPKAVTPKFADESWEELLAHFDKMRRAGGTRMY